MTKSQVNTISFVAVSLFCCFAFPTLAGSIRVTIDCPDPLRATSAIERRLTPTGIEMHETRGTVEGQRIVIDGLRIGVRYDLRIETASGLIEGWNATVPASGYEPEQPLSIESRDAIFAKIAKVEARAFFDEVAVLDVAGNIQHAAVLVFKFHNRGFVESADRGPDWVWRVDRLEYENPEEQSWVPHPKLAFYALERHRVTPDQYGKLRVLFDRRLGGIAVSSDRPDVNLGTLAVPAPPPGIHACDETGSIIAPAPLKPMPATDDVR